MTSRAVRADVAVPAGLSVRLDGSALTGLLEDILKTAIDYNRANRLLLAARIDDGQVCITIADNAAGADADPGMRASDIQDLTDRTALLGGRLEIEAQPGGTTLTLRLAASSYHPDDGATSRARQDLPPERTATAPMAPERSRPV